MLSFFPYDKGHGQVVKCVVPAFRAANQISNSQPFLEVLLSSLCDAPNLFCVHPDPVTRRSDTGTDSPRGTGGYLQDQNKCVGAERKE